MPNVYLDVYRLVTKILFKVTNHDCPFQILLLNTHYIRNLRVTSIYLIMCAYWVTDGFSTCDVRQVDNDLDDPLQPTRSGPGFIGGN
jgi:hypothetical protein